MLCECELLKLWLAVVSKHYGHQLASFSSVPRKLTADSRQIQYWQGTLSPAFNYLSWPLLRTAWIAPTTFSQLHSHSLSPAQISSLHSLCSSNWAPLWHNLFPFKEPIKNSHKGGKAGQETHSNHTTNLCYWHLLSPVVWAQGSVVLWKVMTILHCLSRACCRNFLRPDWEPPAICRISLENPLVPNWQERSWSVRGPETWINHFVWCILFNFQLMLRGVGGKLTKVCWPQQKSCPVIPVVIRFWSAASHYLGPALLQTWPE